MQHNSMISADRIDRAAVECLLARMELTPSRRLAWDDLVRLEPRLQDLWRDAHARAGRDDLDHVWYGRTGIKRKLCRLVGHDAERANAPDDLYTSAAYDVAYRTLLAIVEGA